MATRADIESTYNYMDRIWRLSMGDHADITCALYGGHYQKSLEQAQADKHAYILDQIQFRPGGRVLDVGCGWGGFLLTVRERGGVGVGLTLSTRQAEHCRRVGLDVRLMDWNEVEPAALGGFDAVVCVGALEHFCSEGAYQAGLQEQIYHRFFALCHHLLRAHARLFVQTMLWGAIVPDPTAITLSAPPDSDDYRLAVLRRFYPGSWLPTSLRQLERSAAPYFCLVLHSNGRQDYVRTMQEWGSRLRRFTWRKVLAVVRLAPWLLMDRDLRYRVELVRGHYHQRCFERQIMDHERIVFEHSDAA